MLCFREAVQLQLLLIPQLDEVVPLSLYELEAESMDLCLGSLTDLLAFVEF